MRLNLLTSVFCAIFLTGCLTAGSNTKSKAQDNKNIATQSVDLDADGRKEIVETENKFDKEGLTLITVKRQLKKKETEKIDSFSVAGKIRRLEFFELYFDRRQQIAVTFDDKDGVSNVVVYEFKNGKFSQMFLASSKYGIEVQSLGVMTKIKIGKTPQGGESCPNRVPDWEVWVWTGDKFIKD